MTSYTPFKMLHYLNVFVPVWSKSSKTWNQQLAMIWYLVYVQVRQSGLLVKLSHHPYVNECETNRCIWSGSEILYEVELKKQEGLLEFCCVKAKRAGELCCRVIRASGCSDNRFLGFFLFQRDDEELLHFLRQSGETSQNQRIVFSADWISAFCSVLPFPS